MDKFLAETFTVLNSLQSLAASSNNKRKRPELRPMTDLQAVITHCNGPCCLFDLSRKLGAEHMWRGPRKGHVCMYQWR